MNNRTRRNLIAFANVVSGAVIGLLWTVATLAVYVGAAYLFLWGVFELAASVFGVRA
ncbi:MAG: hypothetical protein ABIQ18_06840 [Umezawaea sp.]